MNLMPTWAKVSQKKKNKKRSSLLLLCSQNTNILRHKHIFALNAEDTEHTVL